ncbi:MAG: hypothetical protein ACOCYN_03205, partial [Planctomycetota bacterium]
MTRYTCRVLEQGLLFVDAEVRYRFEDGSWYRLELRMLHNDPAIRVTEEADFEEVGDPREPRVAFSL